ncbi:biotin-dependent carboxyltransferase family protein [Corynebacterium freiburgense]|uniref:5-oxoprolinase subunit C family protein n=1 Tax=Corynebacterium freiburgense TaxID=556548 RepID=UPI000410D3CD|nr:biotin-dependent carboxyltransferase family protein [Corynebacterium freiburgense]WJZ02196.1 KipI antagonist [Corynebacterium freiburgense]
MLEIVAPGPLALFQDRGRPGFANTGVSPSGCFDRLSAARANHAVGNAPEAPVIEILIGGFQAKVLADTTGIFTGTAAPITITTSQGKRHESYTNTLLDLHAGDIVSLGYSSYGLRAYFALRGGFDVPLTLGSASTDVLSNLGPAPIKAGDLIRTSNFAVGEHWWPKIRQLPPLWRPKRHEELTVILGPRSDWFYAATVLDFLAQDFQVSPESNRIGLRLKASRPLERSRKDELLSEGMVRGSIQVPPSGDPVVFGPDHPVTGGYPVIAVLTSRSCDRAAQLGAGDTVRFRLA